MLGKLGKLGKGRGGVMLAIKQGKQLVENWNVTSMMNK